MIITNETERLKALYSYQMLDTDAEKHYDSIVYLASYICKKSIAVINLIDDHRLWLKAKIGIDACQFPRDTSFCTHTIQQEGILEIKDTQLDNRFQDSIYVVNEPHIRYYVGFPLINSDGYALGSICLFDTKPGALDEQQKTALKILAGEVVLHLEASKKNHTLKHLLEEQQKFQSLFNNSNELHCVTNEAGDIEFVNQHVKQLLGYSVEEVIGKKILDFCVPSEKKAVLSKIKQAADEGKQQLELAIQMLSKNGEIRHFGWFNVYSNNQWLCNGRDTTNQMVAEKELQQLSLVASHVNNGVVINDNDNKILWVNKAFEKITGYILSEIKGKQLRHIITGENTDKKILSYSANQSNEKKSFSIEILGYNKDKNPIWLSVMNSVILNDEGEISKSIEIITDITEQKKTAMEMQTLSIALEKSESGLLIRDNQEQVLWMNESMENIFGYSLPEIKGKVVGSEFVGKETDVELFKMAKNASFEKKPYNIEIALYRKNKTRVWVSIYNNFLFDHEGNVVRQFSIATDITMRKLAEQELIRTREEALQLSRAKETFISVLSHEIRTPINAILGITRFLIDEKPAAHQLENLSILNFSSNNLLHLINNVLDFTKIETGNVVLESIPVNLKNLAKRTLNTLEFKLDNKNVKLALSLDDRIPEFVIADSTRLYQIMINLLGNAIKFTSKGEVKLALCLTNETEHSVTINFCVSDTGIGIPADKLNDIFEPYKQAAADTTRKYGGTGLGLTITKKLVELHQSTIKVKSDFGFGCDFSFSIQFKRAKIDDSPTDILAINQVISSSVLVVDDNAINRTLAKKVLSKWGIHTDLAENGLEAYKMITKKDYDLVLIDLHMPVMDGVEATKRIRMLAAEKYQTLPIIALTGSSYNSNLEGLHNNGLTDYFLKPYTPEGLYKKIQPYLKQPALV